MPELRPFDAVEKACIQGRHQNGSHARVLCANCARAYAASETAPFLAVAMAAQGIVDDLESNNSEVHNREWWGVEPMVIQKLRLAVANPVVQEELKKT